MNRVIGLCVLGVSVALLSPACGSDDGDKQVPHKGQPDGQSGEGGERTSGGTAPSDGGEAGSGARAGSAGVSGTGGTQPANAGAGGTPLGNAGEPSVGGANGGEAGSGGDAGSGGEGGGEGPTGNVVYASFGTKLVWLEPETAKLHEVGDMRSAQGDVTYAEVVFAYGNVPGEAWIVTPRYKTSNGPAPQLGKLDLRTGVVSELAAVTRVGTAPTALEGFALHPNGTWYVSTGINPPGGTVYLSNKLGTLNVTTRAIIDLPGTVNTLQDDMDSMVFAGDTLYGIDVATGNSKHELVTANLTTGVVTQVAAPTATSTAAVPLRIAYDDSRSKAYAWRESDRNLLTMSLANGIVTAVGQTHAANVYPSQVTQGFAVAPVCP